MTKKVKRTKTGQFAAGASGNPTGRPTSFNTQLKELLAADAPLIIQQVVDAAKAGDMTAAKIILDRVLPPLKAIAPPVQIDGLGVSTSALDQAQLVLSATGKGSLAPDLAAQLLTGISALLKIKEVEELQQRLDALENQLKPAKELAK